MGRIVQVSEDSHCLGELSSILTTVKKDSKEKCLEMFQVNYIITCCLEALKIEVLFEFSVINEEE